MNQIYCVLDYETRSKANLKKVGAYEYARHPSTQLLCVSWRVGTFDELKKLDVEPKAWTPAIPSSYGELKRALLDPNVILVAHNAFFEQVITRFVLSRLISDPGLKEIPPKRWVCTASLARALALPGKLAEACAALKLPVQKDMGGHRLMLKMSRPRKPSAKNPAVWHAKKSDLLRLVKYCQTDTSAEAALFTSIPPLSPEERKVWLLDQKINWRGFRADRPVVEKILAMVAVELARFERETAALTRGVVTSTAQRDATLRWLKGQGLELPNLQKKTVEDALKSNLATGNAASLLQIRQEASKTSTAKYEAFEARSRSDGRVRDNLVYHTASTGRWGGAGVQPQNFPRPTLKETDFATEIVADPATDLELIRLLYGNPLDLFSNLLRSMIIPSEGRKLFGGDFAGIEVRVLFWMAKHEAGLRAFREGRDLYVEMAREIFGRKITKENNEERQLGKTAILGCGFGMGRDKFFGSCKDKGQEVTEELAQLAVQAYRRTHWPVPRFWSNLEKAAIAAVLKPGTKYTVNRTSWFVRGKFLYCQLPSGRLLAYYGPEIRQKATPWGEVKPTLYHWDVHPKTRKWVLNGTYGGKLAENVVQATARDLMAASMRRVEDAGYELLITVHDELLAEKDQGSAEEFERLMAESPHWAEGLPVKVEAWEGKRYRK